MSRLRNILKLIFIVILSSIVHCKIFDGPCPKIQSSDATFDCEAVFDENEIYVPLANLPVGDQTINIYHNPFGTVLNCLRMKFDCPSDKNLVFMTPRCYPGKIDEDTIDYRDCMAILSPMTDQYRGAKGSYQPSHECTDKIANYTTNFLVTDSGVLVLWGCRELTGAYKGKHSEGAWVFVKASDEKKSTGTEVTEAMKLLKNVSAKQSDFIARGETGRAACKCPVCTYGTDCSMPHKSSFDD